jgi:hypothetical protein
MEEEPTSPLAPEDMADSAGDDGLLQFIRSETLQSKRLSQSVVVETFACTLWKGFFDMKHRLYQINNLDVQQAVETGITLIDNLFWILFNCSSNLQLTLFLTERGRLLYSEFLSMSRTHALMQNADVYPTIQDGFQFAIKKSIGTLTCSIKTGSDGDEGEYYCNSNANPLTFESISTYRKVYRSVFENINRKYLTDKEAEPWNADHVNISLHKLNQTLTDAIQRPHSIDILEHVVCAELQTTDAFAPGLLSYLLALQLVCSKGFMCGSGTGGAKRLTSIRSQLMAARIAAVKTFVMEHAHVLDSTLSFLCSASAVQRKWAARMAEVGKGPFAAAD